MQEQILPLLQKNLQSFFGGAVFLIVLLYFFVGMLPQLAHLGTINAQLKQKKEEINQAKADISKHSFYESELNKAIEENKRTAIKIVTQEEIPALLEGISRIAVLHRIKIDQIEAIKTTPQVLQSNKLGKFYVFPVRVQAKGGYHDIGKFVDKLEKDSFFKSIGGLSILHNKEDPTRHLLTMTVNSVILEKGDN